MKNKFLLALTPLLSINTFIVLLNGCNSHTATPMCAYYYKASLTDIDNADSVAHVAGSGGVPAKAFYLALSLRDTFYTCMRENAPFRPNAAYAEHFDETKLLPIDSVSLTSDHDFDAAHPAGSDLKDLFNISDTGRINYLHGGSNNFYLLHSPSEPGTHTFTIRLFAADSTKNLIATSLPVTLLL